MNVSCSWIFETFYDQKEYTLKKLTPPEYILDPRFEVIMCAIAINNGPSTIIDGPDLPAFLATINPTTTATVTYNSLFDNSILAWRYGWVPAQMYDSMNMARALRGHILPDLRLATVAPMLLDRKKGDTVLKVSGMRRADIQALPDLWRQMCEYCNEDNNQSRDIFRLLLPEFPKDEHKVMDLVIRCAVEPKLVLDKELLTQHLKDVRDYKENLLKQCEVDKTILMSNPKFQAALENLGVEIEYKTSKATGKQAPAFAKTDQFMADLQEHPDIRVQALVAARLGLKTTIEETRCQKMLSIASLPWSAESLMPVPLKYAGAHTHRLSGDWRLNMQNLPRGSTLRKSLVAPTGSSVMVADLAQIEARLVAWLAGCHELVEAFRNKEDIYLKFAEEIFGRGLMKENKVERFIGKTGILGLGYQCWVDKFYNMVITLARLMKVDVSSLFDKKLAEKTVWAYRNKYSQISALWKKLQWVVGTSWLDGGVSRIGPIIISQGEIKGPTGLKMKYNLPEHIIGDDQKDLYLYQYGKQNYYLYGGKLLENIIQFLARIIVMDAAVRLDALGYRFCLQAHDELVFVVPENDVANAKDIIYAEMTRPPQWGPDIPLDAEVKSGRSYGDCK